jgi:transcriptional regulator with XRE-family HTH domain
MESIGEKFRVTREQKGYSIEQISRDTNIAKRFLQALESEDFKAFPGEPYLLGFLRNYAEYLGLDPEEITTLYKHMMIQEQPIPMAELIVRKKGKAPVVVILAVVAAAGILTAGYFLLLPRLRSPRPEKAPTETAAERTGADVYVLSEEVVERRFSEGQVIQVTIKDVPYRIVIEEIGEKVTLALGSRKVQIRLGRRRISTSTAIQARSSRSSSVTSTRRRMPSFFALTASLRRSSPGMSRRRRRVRRRRTGREPRLNPSFLLKVRPSSRRKPPDRPAGFVSGSRQHDRGIAQKGPCDPQGGGRAVTVYGERRLPRLLSRAIHHGRADQG